LIRQADRGLGHRRQLDLGLLRRLEQALQGLRVGPQVDPVVALEVVGQVVDDAAVEVVAAEVGVARGRTHLDHAVGSLMIRRTSSPAIRPASLVACRWASLKYAGTVMTASVIFSPRNFDASSTSLRRT
jgi:hypothetical protein